LATKNTKNTKVRNGEGAAEKDPTSVIFVSFVAEFSVSIVAKEYE
jgi:hypothetical protein